MIVAHSNGLFAENMSDHMQGLINIISDLWYKSYLSQNNHFFWDRIGK